MDSNGARNGASRPTPDDSTRSSDLAQLSALSSTLDDLSGRITSTAHRYQGTTREDVASRLFEVERSLRTASRHLAKTMQALG